MACTIMLQYDPPANPVKLQEYSAWVTSEVIPSILNAEGAKEVRGYRAVGEGSPQVTALLEFEELNHAISFMASEAWTFIVTTSRSVGIGTLQVTLMIPSPLVPEPATD